MSPEQAWGKPIDRRSDLFSLGSVLFEMLTGEKLFGGDTDLSLLEKVRAADVPAASALNPEVPKGLDAILARTLAREPDERYSNASDLLRDLESVLYSYTPAPGSADVAIYLHRLQAEDAAAADARARGAALLAPPEPPKKRRSKGTPVARRPTGSAPKFVQDLAASAAEAVKPPARAPAPPKEVARLPPVSGGVYGIPPASRAQGERKSRAVLFAAIGVALIVLAAAVAWWMMLPSGASKAAPPLVATLLPAPTFGPGGPTVVPAAGPAVTPAATPAPAGYDPKAIEAEVQRQLAVKKKELQKALVPPPPSNGKPARGADAAAAEKAPGQAKEEPTPAVSALTPAAAKDEPAPTGEPTAAPTRPAPAAESLARSTPAEVSRGDLVGPGPGVIEPALLGPPRITYPPIARQQRISGRVIVLVLVDENGDASEARLVQGLTSKVGVNEAVVEGVRKSRFRPATKNGVPVKMWRTVVVDVQP
jgi:TonB family protein